MSVAVVHLMATLMERQLDAPAGELLQRDLDARGIVFFTNGATEEILGTERAEGVRLADGRMIPADLVVLAIGIRPNIELARSAKLDVNRGILVGDDMRTSGPDIFAVGECIEHNGQVFGLIAPILEQAKVCGARLAGDNAAVYVPPPVFTSLKITGIDVFSAGALAAADEGDHEITLHDAKCGVYRKVILRDDRVVGSVLYGNAADGPWYVELMRDKIDVAAFRDQLVFGRGYAEQAGAALETWDEAA
jgi:nitrite reductase (NADH) large subunit